MNWLHIDGTTKLHSLLLTLNVLVPVGGFGRRASDGGGHLQTYSQRAISQPGSQEELKAVSVHPNQGYQQCLTFLSWHLGVSEMKFMRPPSTIIFFRGEDFSQNNSLHHSRLIHILNYFYFHRSSLFLLHTWMTKHQIILFLNICLCLTEFSKKCWTKPLFFFYTKNRGYKKNYVELFFYIVLTGYQSNRGYFVEGLSNQLYNLFFFRCTGHTACKRGQFLFIFEYQFLLMEYVLS